MGILTLITFLLFLMPSISFSQYLGNNILTHRKFFPKLEARETHKSFAVIFDAGSSGSRVHVYHFDQNLTFMRFDNKFEFVDKVEPGLSAYPNDPAGAAASLTQLLVGAKEKIMGSCTQQQDCEQVLSRTPLILGGTAGLRGLDKNDSKRIMDAVRVKLRVESGMNVKSVNIISGEDEGAYMWATVNYLLGTMGERFKHTIGTIELGGASVQMAYALPKGIQARDPSYVKQMKLGNAKHDLYVYSYLGFGSDKFREKIFTDDESHEHPCRLAVSSGNTYSNVEDEASTPPPPPPSKYDQCRDKVLDVFRPYNQGRCPDHGEIGGCTFDGIWNGGMGMGQDQLFATGSFYYVPANVGMVRPEELNPEVSIKDFETKAKEVCGLTFDEAKEKYRGVKEKYLRNICVDLTYQYAFLVDGLKLNPEKKIILGQEIRQRGVKVEAAWTLGTALETISTLKNFQSLMYFI